jgi:hypothetical protein
MPLSFPASPATGATSVQNGRTYKWSGYAWQFVSNVAAHKSTHATGGTDALTASDIGAASSSHTHAASDITTGTLSQARLDFIPIHPFLLMGG